MNDIMPDGMCADEQEQDYRNVNFRILFALKIISFLALNNDEIETTKDVRSLFSVLFFVVFPLVFCLSLKLFYGGCDILT